MPAAIFNGQYVKVLKDELKAKSGGLFDKVYTSAKSTAFTAATGFTYLVNTGTAVTVTLPAVSTYASIVIKDSTGTAGTNAITITPANLRGYSTIVLNAPGETVTCLFKNSNWNVIANQGATIS